MEITLATDGFALCKGRLVFMGRKDAPGHILEKASDISPKT